MSELPATRMLASGRIGNRVVVRGWHEDDLRPFLESQAAEIARMQSALIEVAHAASRNEAEAARFEAERDALRADTERLDWLEAHPREGSMRFDDGTFKSVKSWAIAAAPEVSLRAAIDAARTQAHKDATPDRSRP